MSKRGTYNGGGTIIKAAVPSSKGREPFTGADLAAYAERCARRAEKSQALREAIVSGEIDLPKKLTRKQKLAAQRARRAAKRRNK